MSDQAAAPAATEISSELQNQINSIRAIAQTHNLLNKGMFPVGFSQAINQSLDFLQALHTQSVKQALEHPQASLVPELVEQGDKSNVETE